MVRARITTTDRMASYAVRFHRALRSFWRGLREWCGDAAYERYLRSPATSANLCPRLTREQFYLEQLNRRYSRPNRCC
jgi:uncharacterized short protein YbdD (DUF466 family)